MFNLLPLINICLTIKIFSLGNESEFSEEICRTPKRGSPTSAPISTNKGQPPSVNSSFQQSLFNYEGKLGYFCKYINNIHKDEFTDLTDLLEKIKKLDFSLAKRTSQLRPLAQLLNRLQMLTECASDQGNSLVHAEEQFERSNERVEIDDSEVERTKLLQNILGSTENTATRFENITFCRKCDF